MLLTGSILNLINEETHNPLVGLVDVTITIKAGDVARFTAKTADKRVVTGVVAGFKNVGKTANIHVYIDEKE